MKRLTKNILWLAPALMWVSCEENDAPFMKNEFSDVSFVNSHKFDKYASPYIEIGKAVNFIDLSHNAISHVWEIDPGCYYLSKDIDASITDYRPYIIPGSDSISTEQGIQVLFDEAGEKFVRLYNLFKDSVTYKGLEATTELVVPSQWSDELGAWVFDHKVRFYVLDSLQLAYDIIDHKADTLASVATTDYPTTDAAQWDTLSVEVGKSLTYRLGECLGEPNETTWVLNGATAQPARTASEVVATYSKMGTYKAGSVKIERLNPVNVNSNNKMPEASKQKSIPYMIRVTAPTDALEAGTLQAFSGQSVIRIPLNIELNHAGNASEFLLTCTHDYASIPMTVTKTAIDPQDPTQLLLTVSGPVYSDDELELVYTKGTVKDIYGRVMADFTQSFTAATENLVAPTAWMMHDFEEVGTSTQSKPVYFKLSSTQAYTGVSSLHYEAPQMAQPKAVAYYIGGSNGLSLPNIETDAHYIVRFNIFLVEPMSTFEPVVRFKLFAPAPTQVIAPINFEDTDPLNTWIEKEGDLDLMNATLKLTQTLSFNTNLSFQFNASKGEVYGGNFYLDNFRVYRKDRIYRPH